jgi:hypothetical protein
MKRLFFVAMLLALGLPAVAQAEVGEAEAMTKAVQRATVVGLSAPLTVESSGASSLARSRDVLEHGNNSGADPTETGYPFVLHGNSTFHANVPLPRKVHLAPERYLAVTISEDWLEETLSDAPISIAALGTVVTVDISSTQATASSKGSCDVDALLVQALGRKHLHARLARAQRSLAKCEARRP